MIGNKYLKNLYDYPDVDTSINQLLELLASNDPDFLESLTVPLEIAALDEAERHYLTIIFAIIDHQLQLSQLAVPNWIRDRAFCFDQPYFIQKDSAISKRSRSSTPSPALSKPDKFSDPDGLKRV